MSGIRTHTFSWPDPHEALEAGREMSGLDYLHAIRDGKLPPPPIIAAMGFDRFDAERGRAEFSMVPLEYHTNLSGLVHGGVTATLLDSALGCAIGTLQAPGTGWTTVELSVRYMRPITVQTGRVTCVANVLNAGRQVATAEGTVRDESGKLYAHGVTTVFLYREEGRQRYGAEGGR